MQKLLKRPLVSVILTSYNHAKFLRASIESVLGQTYKDFELIIVDDCSSDESWDIICSYSDDRIRKVRHFYNYGSGVLKDTINRYARGKYIAVHHSDDVWMLDKLQKQLDFLTRHREYKIVFTNVSVINEEGEEYQEKDGFYFNAFKANNKSRYEWLRYFLINGNCLCHPSVLMERNVYKHARPFGVGLKQVPDLLLWIRICKFYNIYVLPEKLVKFRIQHAGRNTSGKRMETQIRSSIESMFILQEYVSIKKHKDFEKIFPEIELKGRSKRDIIIAFAKFCLDKRMPEYAHLFALQTIYTQLNTRTGKKLLTQYEIDTKEFFRYTGEFDVFKLIKPYSDQEATLYVAFGDDKWKEIRKEQYYLDDKKTLSFLYDISILEDDIVALRFDPCESVYVKAINLRCEIDGHDIHPRNFGKGSSEEDGLYFWSKDPIIIMDYIKGKHLKISMIIERL